MISSKREYIIKTLKNNIHIIPKSNKYSKVIFFMHGLGDSADSFIDVFTQYDIVPQDFKIVLLNAEIKPVSINFGMEMPSWYDILALNESDPKKSVSQPDVIYSKNRILSFVNEEIKELNNDYSKVYIGGFSQGGCMALYTGLSVENKNQNFGGLLCLSGLLFPFTPIAKNILNKDMPIFIGHGLSDNVIPYELANKSYELLKSFDFTNLKIKNYDVGHSLNEKEIMDIKDFLC